MKKLFLLFILISSFQVYPQNGSKNISLEDIWRDYRFFPKYFEGFESMPDGHSYTALDSLNNLARYDFKTGKFLGNLLTAKELIPEGKQESIPLSHYTFSEDASLLLITTNQKPIYRHSATSIGYVFNFKSRKLSPLSDEGPQMFASFSPIGNKVAFVRENNLFIKDLLNSLETKVTQDGENNKIKNGWADWVYEEEFSKAEAFSWNADGSKLAYIRFDESSVKEYEMDIYNNLYPTEYKFKYPKAGENNSVVSVWVYDLKSGKTTSVDIGAEKDIYIPRIEWTKNPNILSVQRMNRLQNKLELLFYDAISNTTKVILTRNAKTYIDITDDLVFLPNDKGFIWSGEEDEYNHLYHFDFNGKRILQITKGKWDVMEFKGYNPATRKLYYISTEVSATDRDLFSIDLEGTGKLRLSKGNGTTDADFSSTFDFYVSTYSTANMPPVFELHSADGKLIKVLEDNAKLKTVLTYYRLSKKEFFTMKTRDGLLLNGWMMKPTEFQPEKKYPVFQYAYGGPGANQCNNNWSVFDGAWHQMLCQQGYIVVCVDNRGTLGRGREFKHSTYLQLGKFETEDQIDVAQYVGGLPFADKSRIGFFGWSFGGYLSSLLITKGADYFKANIAVAPVTNWRYYDNIYTERFLRTPQENPSGYDDNSPVNFASKLKGKFLLIHGTADDNVHFQNSMEMAKALVSLNKPFDFMAYPNKNHGISGGLTRLHLYNKVLNFILTNL